MKKNIEWKENERKKKGKEQDNIDTHVFNLGFFIYIYLFFLYHFVCFLYFPLLLLFPFIFCSLILKFLFGFFVLKGGGVVYSYSIFEGLQKHSKGYYTR